jgi:glucoamylase
VAPTATRATWRFTAPRPTMVAGRVLRLELLAPARVRYSLDGWKTWADIGARDTGVGVWVADVPGSDGLVPGQAADFTVWWPEAGHWEGRNLRVSVAETVDSGRSPSSSG